MDDASHIAASMDADMQMKRPALSSPSMRWLDWARPIVDMASADPGHLAWCQMTLGGAAYSGDRPEDDPTLRWPGYIGSEWREGVGVLFVGSVHSDFAKENGRHPTPSRRAVVDRLAAANEGWRSAPRSPDRDGDYLRETQKCYERLAPGWTRGAVIGGILESTYPDLTEQQRFARAAWTNLAHCRAVPKAVSEYKLQLQCSGAMGAYPIGSLVRGLRPAAIVASVRPLVTQHSRHYDWGEGDAHFVAFSGGGPTAGSAGDEPSAIWMPKVVAHLRELESRD